MQMNLTEMIETWVKATVDKAIGVIASAFNERIEALVNRSVRLEKDNETLAKRMLELEGRLSTRPITQPPGDLSFMAQRIKELEDVVGANCRRQDGNVEMLIRRVNELEHEDLVSRIEDHLDQDAFRDRMTEFFTASLDGDEVSEKIKELVEDHLDDEIDNLEVKIRRG